MPSRAGGVLEAPPEGDLLNEDDRRPDQRQPVERRAAASPGRDATPVSSRATPQPGIIETTTAIQRKVSIRCLSGCFSLPLRRHAGMPYRARPVAAGAHVLAAERLDRRHPRPASAPRRSRGDRRPHRSRASSATLESTPTAPHARREEWRACRAAGDSHWSVRRMVVTRASPPRRQAPPRSSR